MKHSRFKAISYNYIAEMQQQLKESSFYLRLADLVSARADQTETEASLLLIKLHSQKLT